MKAGIYLRVSTDMQARDGESLAEQEATCQAYCNFRNIPIVNIYREEGRSGKDTNRPQFQRMIKDCKLGKIDTIIVKKVDRLSRSLIDFEKTIKFFEDQNANLISINENFDTSTAIGRAVIRIILTFAQLEREQTSERTIDVLKFRATQGQWNGGYPPLGYNYDKDLGLVINLEESKLVILIYDKYIELASYKKVADHLNNLGYRTRQFISRRGKTQGGKKFTDTFIARTLKNPVYIGKIQYKGQIHSGRHQTIIDKDKYDKIQEIIKQNTYRNTSINKQNKHNFILEGLIRCGDCGSVMTPRWCVSSSTKKRYFYYGCTSVGHTNANACPNRAISAPILEQVILNHVRTISKDEGTLQKIINYNGETDMKEIEELDSKRLILKLKLKEVEDKASGLVNKLSQLPDLAGMSFIKEELGKLEKDKTSIKQAIEDIALRITKLKDRIINKDLVQESFRHFSDIYHQLTPELKHQLVSLLIKGIRFTKTYITINFFITNDISEFTATPARRPGSQRLWTGSAEETRSQHYTARYNIDTYRREKGKYYYGVASCLN